MGMQSGTVPKCLSECNLPLEPRDTRLLLIVEEARIGLLQLDENSVLVAEKRNSPWSYSVG